MENSIDIQKLESEFKKRLLESKGEDEQKNQLLDKIVESMKLSFAKKHKGGSSKRKKSRKNKKRKTSKRTKRR